MQIQVNKNIDNYKDDFFKGLSLREAFVAVMVLVSGVGSFAFCFLILKIPQTIALYCALPLPIFIGAVGFLKIHGMSLPEYFKRKSEVTNMPVFFYRPSILQDCQKEGGRQKTGKDKSSKKAENLYLETEHDLNGGDFFEEEHAGL